MLVECEAGCLESRAVVALLATIAPRSRRELSIVFVLVAIDALRKLQFEYCALTGRRVTRHAFDGRMRECEREAGIRMVGH